jgi:hypothetical protein
MTLPATTVLLLVGMVGASSPGFLFACKMFSCRDLLLLLVLLLQVTSHNLQGSCSTLLLVVVALVVI